MSQGPSPDTAIDLPSQFFSTILRDIPVRVWAQLFSEHPSAKESVLKGVSTRPEKLARALEQAQILERLENVLGSDRLFWEAVLKSWGQEQLPVVAFLEMLEPGFIVENLESLKNLIGPERCVAALLLLENLPEETFAAQLTPEFWERSVDSEAIEPLLPVWFLWAELVRDYPQAQTWLEGVLPKSYPAAGERTGREAAEPAHRELERQRKVERKLEKTEAERGQLQEQLLKARRESDALRQQVADWEARFTRELEEALSRQHAEWLERYRGVDAASVDEAHRNLEQLIKRADRAFALQAQADAQFGRVATVRQQLLQVELYLQEIERIYADSLVVHTEVERVKAALIAERRRLLQLPGIGKVLRKEPVQISDSDLRQRLRFLDSVPEHLPTLSQLKIVVERLETLGFLEDSEPLLADIELKRRQICEALYASMRPPKRAAARKGYFPSLEAYIKSGQSRDADLYADGYNILLSVVGDARRGGSLSGLREAFIEAVCAKSRHFRKVTLVFDGTEDSRDLRGNVEIVYTDKRRGTTADSVLIRTIRAHSKEPPVLLVTADQEIIEAVDSQLFALVAPQHFYMFVFDAHFPRHP